MKNLLLLLPVVALSACMTTRGEVTEAELAKASKSCLAFGLQAGTEAMAICMSNQVEQSREANRARIERTRQALDGMSMPPRATTQTRCHMLGSTLNCTSY